MLHFFFPEIKQECKKTQIWAHYTCYPLHVFFIIVPKVNKKKKKLLIAFFFLCVCFFFFFQGEKKKWSTKYFSNRANLSYFSAKKLVYKNVTFMQKFVSAWRGGLTACRSQFCTFSSFTTWRVKRCVFFYGGNDSLNFLRFLIILYYLYFYWLSMLLFFVIVVWMKITITESCTLLLASTI